MTMCAFLEPAHAGYSSALWEPRGTHVLYLQAFLVYLVAPRSFIEGYLIGVVRVSK